MGEESLWGKPCHPSTTMYHFTTLLLEPFLKKESTACRPAPIGHLNEGTSLALVWVNGYSDEMVGEMRPKF